MNAVKMHFSIDDVILTLKNVKDIKPNSIFDIDFYKTLRQWHEKYNLQISLYVYEVCNGFSINELPAQYWNEFKENASWLKFYWHRRKSGELTDGFSAEIESFLRVKNFIYNNISPEAWDDTVRLHKFSGSKELINFLKKHGNLKCLLCSDCEHLSYDLSTEDGMKLKNGVIEQNNLIYKQTDIRLDYITENHGETVQSLISKSLEILDNRQDKNITVFFHEWQFNKIRNNVEKYLQGLLKTTLYINTAIIIESYLYFTTCYENKLFRTDFNGNIEVIASLPIKKDTHAKFISMHCYNNYIWLIPWTIDSIYLYDLCNKKIQKLPLPRELNQNKQHDCFRTCLQLENKLWLLPDKYKGIIKVDMNATTYEIFNHMPDNLLFSSASNRNFTMMCESDGYLYLFGEGCNRDIRFHIISQKYEIWHEKSDSNFGVIANRKLFISPKKERDKVKVYELETNNLIEEVSLPNYVWQPIKYYSYWFAATYDDKIFMMPNEANGIIIKDIVFNRMDIVKIKTDNHSTLKESKNYGVYQILRSTKDLYVLIPHKGNKVVFIDGKGKLIKEIILKKIIDENRADYVTSFKDKEGALNEYLFNLLQYDCIDWNSNKNLYSGSDIHSCIINYFKEENKCPKD